MAFGAIAAVRMSSLIKAGSHLTQPRYLIIVLLLLVIGIGAMQLGIGEF